MGTFRLEVMGIGMPLATLEPLPSSILQGLDGAAHEKVFPVLRLRTREHLRRTVHASSTSAEG